MKPRKRIFVKTYRIGGVGTPVRVVRGKTSKAGLVHVEDFDGVNLRLVHVSLLVPNKND